MRSFFAVLLLAFWAPLCLGQITSISFMHDGMIRNFDIHFPPGWAISDSAPVLLDLHYLGADGRDEDTLTRFNPIGDAEGFIVCHPWGFFSDWNVGQEAPYASGTKDVSFIDAIIDTLHVRYGVDLQRVYAVGMGQGGFMVQRLACELGDRIAAFASVGASIHDSAVFYCNSNRPIPMMMIQGTADTVIHYQNGLPGIWRNIPQLVDFWKTRNNCSGSEITVNLPNTVNEGSSITSHRWQCDQSAEVLLFEVINGGFAWPGANRDLGSGGIRNMDINASEHIWKFLKRYTLTTFTPLEVKNELGPAKAVSVFPNPVSDWLHVAIDSGRLPDLKIKDLLGKRIEVNALRQSPNAVDLDLSALPSGVYLLEMGTTVKRVVVR